MTRLIPAKRMQHIAPFRVMETLAQARAMQANGVDVVHMEVGEPDFPAPPQIIEAAQAALRQGMTHYTPAAGLPALREALAGYYADRFGVDIDPRRIIVTPGASGALQLAWAVLVNLGDKVLLQDPGYPCNRHMVRLFGGEPIAIAQSGGATDPMQLQVDLAGARGAMLASPANPTGEVLAIESLREIYRAIDSERQFLLVDEIYQGLQYGTPIDTALTLGEAGLFVINSFSKYFGMTGFRLGWMVVPSEFSEPVERLAQNLFLAPPTVAQYAAMAAFTPEVRDELEYRRGIFQRRRDLLFKGLADAGFGLPERPPEGAFYVYANVDALGRSGEEFAAELLRQTGVAITPGADFGQRETDRHVRFAYTTDERRIEEGLARIARYVANGAG
ncbi:MAG: aminotransferase class I/II-fold pyridoxal phosphate-dependent enzyme [Exilibacterium sp.]